MADSYKAHVKDTQKVILTKEYIPTKEDTQNWCMRVLRNSVKVEIYLNIWNY